METYITEHQYKQILQYIQREYISFAPEKREGKSFFEEFHGHLIQLPVQKTALSFKKFLWLDNREIEHSHAAKKIAFLGLPNCDGIALEIFLKEFENTDLIPKRENILIVTMECLSDQECFCLALGYSHTTGDLHIQKENRGYSLFALTSKGQILLEKNGIKVSNRHPILKPIKNHGKNDLDWNKVTKALEDKKGLIDSWQTISNNCFGCGACSVVCPLCFCTKQIFENTLNGGSTECLRWDSCFSKSFSEIQNHSDLRPDNLDRLYNWYHHKFVRSYAKSKHFLCTGCGRCIQACPAHLNQYNIIESFTKKEAKKNG